MSCCRLWIPWRWCYIESNSLINYIEAFFTLDFKRSKCLCTWIIQSNSILSIILIGHWYLLSSLTRLWILLLIRVKSCSNCRGRVALVLNLLSNKETICCNRSWIMREVGNRDGVFRIQMLHFSWESLSSRIKCFPCFWIRNISIFQLCFWWVSIQICGHKLLKWDCCSIFRVNWKLSNLNA